MLEVRPTKRALFGELRPPGDKSMSHRALILGALAHGESRITHLLESDDVQATAMALRQLGVSIEAGNGLHRIEGRGARGFTAPASPLDMGNSGTAMRLMSGILAAQPFSSVIEGDASLSRRPMRRIMEPLRRMGADIRGSDQDTAPLHIAGRRLHGIDYESPVASAQVKSCVLLAGLLADGRTRVSEPVPSRDHTERMLALFGAPLDADGWLQGGSVLNATRFEVPGDPSSAAFPLAAALLVPDSDVRLKGVGMNPTRAGLFDAVLAMGADLEIEPEGSARHEPTGGLRVRHAGRLRAIEVGAAEVPAMVDEIPMLMALAATAEGTTRIRGAAELRVKESDRLAVMGAALQSLGVRVTLFEDGADIEGTDRLRGALTLDSASDHRCAMSLAVLGLVCPGGLRVRGDRFIDTSYPGFAVDLQALGADLRREKAA